jgi:flagellar biosynthesis protein
MRKPDPREVAVALAYRAGQAAPQVVAKGRGLIAETIISEARAHGIYVHKSAELVSLLMQVDLDQHIPPQLYRAVAEVLAWLYKLEAGAALPLPVSANPTQSREQVMPLLTQISVSPAKSANGQTVVAPDDDNSI